MNYKQTNEINNRNIQINNGNFGARDVRGSQTGKRRVFITLKFLAVAYGQAGVASILNFYARRTSGQRYWGAQASTNNYSIMYVCMCVFLSVLQLTC